MLLLFYAMDGIAQTPDNNGKNNPSPVHPWEDIVGTMLEESDNEVADWEATYDILCDLEESPVEINTATREDLERIPFCFLGLVS